VLVRKGEMGDFIAAFNEGLAAIKADGTYDRIYAKWISGELVAAPGGAEASVGIPPAPGFPIKVGVLVPLSGDVKTFGESVRDAAEMAFAEAREAGWEIETVLADTKCDPQEAANAANKVIFEDGVNYIVGAVCSSATIPVSEIAEANQVLMISPTATNPVVTLNEDGSTKEYAYRNCFLDPFQGEVVAALAQELGASKAAVLFDVGNDYVKGLAEYFRTSFEGLGGTVPVFEAYTKDDTDFSAILGKVAAADVDVMFLPDYYNKVNLIAQQAKEKGIEATLLGGDGWDSPELRVDMVEGGYFSNHYSPADPRPVVQDFVAAYSEKYGLLPDSFATLAYDGARILLQAIAEAGVDDPSLVKDTMGAIRFEGVTGQITFDAQHNPVKKAAIVKVENGEKVFFKFAAPPGVEDESAEEPVAEASAGIPPAPGFPIKVGQIVPLSGDVKTFGESSRDGAAMKFEEARALGWEIEVVLADGKCDAQEAANAANKLIFEDGVNYIMGEVCSSATIPISEIAEESQVLIVAPTATNPVITLNEDGSTKEYAFRTCFLDPFQGEVVAALAQELGASKAAVLYDVGNDYVKGLAEYFKSSFEGLGGTVPVFEAYTKDDTDFSAILGKVAAADVDVMFLPDYYNKVNLIAQQAKEKGIEATLLGGDGWDSPELRVDMVEGGYFSNHYSPADPRPLVQDFVAAYKAKYGAEPDALATLAYDAAGILLQAIADAGADDPTLVKDAMAAVKYEGVSGEITFDAQHNPVKKAAVNKVENGQFVFYKFVTP
jgi:branched-chain amino acid transport system substrate-binding protein